MELTFGFEVRGLTTLAVQRPVTVFQYLCVCGQLAYSVIYESTGDHGQAVRGSKYECSRVMSVSKYLMCSYLTTLFHYIYLPL